MLKTRKRGEIWKCCKGKILRESEKLGIASIFLVHLESVCALSCQQEAESPSLGPYRCFWGCWWLYDTGLPLWAPAEKHFPCSPPGTVASISQKHAVHVVVKSAFLYPGVLNTRSLEPLALVSTQEQARPASCCFSCPYSLHSDRFTWVYFNFHYSVL